MCQRIQATILPEVAAYCIHRQCIRLDKPAKGKLKSKNSRLGLRQAKLLRKAAGFEAAVILQT